MADELIHQWKAPRSAKLFNDKFKYHFGAGIYRGFGLVASVVGPVNYVSIVNEALGGGAYIGVLTDPNGLLIHSTEQIPATFTVTPSAVNDYFVVCRTAWAEDANLQPQYLMIPFASYDESTDVILGIVDRSLPISVTNFAPPGPHNWAPENIHSRLGGVKQAMNFDLRYTSAAAGADTDVISSHCPLYGGSAFKYGTDGTIVNKIRVKVWGQSAAAPANSIRTQVILAAMKDDTIGLGGSDTFDKDISGYTNKTYLLYNKEFTVFTTYDITTEWLWKLSVHRLGTDPADTFLSDIHYLTAAIEYNRIAIGEIWP
jgi:hypothetical protein